MNDFAYSNEIGSRYQDIVSRELLKIGIVVQCHTSSFFQLNYGESPQGIEIKHDSKVATTGNLYFEFSAINKNGDQFVNGGIEKQDNAWLYVIGNGKECWVFSKKQLKLLLKQVQNNPDKYRENHSIYIRKHIDKDTNQTTSYGLCVPIDYCDIYLTINHIVFEKDYTKWLENI